MWQEEERGEVAIKYTTTKTWLRLGRLAGTARKAQYEWTTKQHLPEASLTSKIGTRTDELLGNKDHLWYVLAI